MLRVFGILIMASMALGLFLVLDYDAARKEASAGDPVDLTVQEYLQRFPDRFASSSATSGPQDLPRKLADMLPHAPEGWSVRPAEDGDGDVYFPKSGSEVDGAAQKLVADAASSQQPYGPPVVTLTYENGNRRVMIRAVRYDDAGFGEWAAPDDLFAAQTAAATFKAAPVITVRGLDITEDLLPRGFRGRLLMADVGGQIHLRILAPKAMTDRELLPFLETLHVQAMNASVVWPEPGLGALPVIQLAAEMPEADREAYVADRALRAEARLARATAERDAARAAAGLAPVKGASSVPDCTQTNSAIKRCTVGD